MPLPFIIAGAALLAGGYGVKKGVDGYKSHSEADEIITKAKRLYDEKKTAFDNQNKKTQTSLEQLGALELDIGAKFDEFSTIAQDLLQQLNRGRQNKLKVTLPKHQLEKIESYKFTALGVLGSVAGAGVAGTAAGFAVYGGVMTFAAASTGTAISALSGAAATNATMAAIGGGALSAGGLGMAGGAAILSAAVAAPVLAIAGWAYASHGEEALSNARKARDEADRAMEKLGKAEKSLQRTDEYAGRVRNALNEIYAVFHDYLSHLREVDRLIKQAKQRNENAQQLLESKSDEVMQSVENGYALAAILTDIITTPLFKVKVVYGQTVLDKDGMPEMQKDGEGSMILNSSAVNEAITQGRKDFSSRTQS